LDFSLVQPLQVIDLSIRGGRGLSTHLEGTIIKQIEMIKGNKKWVGECTKVKEPIITKYMSKEVDKPRGFYEHF